MTADVAANHDVPLTGDAVVRLTGGTMTYTGTFSGAGTLTITGTGTLVLTRDSDFTLSTDRQHQRLVTYNGNHPLTRLDNPDPPAITVNRGATLQYGDGTGTSGQLARYASYPGGRWNLLNIRVDGTLDVAVHAPVQLGTITGTGLVDTRRNTWPGLDLAGDQPFSGTFVNGTATNYGSVGYNTTTPHLATIVNYGSLICAAADGQTTTLTANVWSKAYGNDINYHTWGSGTIRDTGVYSWSDNASTTAPALSDPALNLSGGVAHHDNTRGINIEGANVIWGDGTDNRFFLPGNAQTAYLNMHFDGRERSRLTLDYNGPVTLGVPIGGGQYHDSLSAAGQGDVVIASTAGNSVTFTAPQHYDGSTTIGRGATLRLGDGTADDDSTLLIGQRFQVIDNGELIVQNSRTATSLSHLTGTGSFRQVGPATTTFTGSVGYHGATTVAGGTLALTAGSLNTSSGVNLTSSGARLDLTAAGPQTLPNLAGSPGSTVTIAATLIVTATSSTTFGGTVTGAGPVTKTGAAVLTLTGRSSQLWEVAAGTLALAGSGAVQAASIGTDPHAMLRGSGTVNGPLTNAGTVQADRLSVRGSYTQRAHATLTANAMTVTGPVTLAGQLTLAPDQTGTIIDNRSDQPVAGTFDGLPEGSTIDGHTITYHGGDGNDVVLTGGHLTTGDQPASTLSAGHSTRTAGQTWLRLTAALALLIAIPGLLWIRHRTRSRHSSGGAA